MKLLRFTVRIPRSAILMFRRRSVRYVCGLAAVSSATWLASAPLTAFFFGRTTPIAIISNLVVIPMAFLIVLTGCLSLVAGSCFVWFAVVFNHVNVALVWVLTGWTRLMAGVPFGDMAVSRPQVWMVFAWYAVLGVIALRCWRARRADASET
jgi:predicted membrane metal-binding protein